MTRETALTFIFYMLNAPIEILRTTSASAEFTFPSPFTSAFKNAVCELINSFKPIEYLRIRSASAEFTFPSPFTSAVDLATREGVDIVL